MTAYNGEISTFKEVFDWICYDFDSCYDLSKDSKGNFVVNKLYITPTELSYKTEIYNISNPDIFKKVSILYSLFKENSQRFITEN